MNAVEEPHFLVNDFLVEATKELEEVITALNKKTPPYYTKAKFLKDFTGNMFHAYHQKKKEWGMEEKYNTIVELKEAEKEEKVIESYIEKKSELEKKRHEEKEKLKKELAEKKAEILKRIEILIKEEQEMAQAKMRSPQQSEELRNQARDINIEIPIPHPQNLQNQNISDSLLHYKQQIPELNKIKTPITQEPNVSLNEIKNSAPAMPKSINIQKTDEYKSFIEPLSAPPPPSELLSEETNQINTDQTNNISEEYGKITNLINNSEIEEIICDGPEESLKIVENKKEKIIELKLTDEEINNIIQNLAKKTEQIVTKENPFLMIEYQNLNIQATITTEHSRPKFVIMKSN